MREYKISITSDASGDSVDTTGKGIFGRLYAVDVEDGDLADDFDITLTYASPNGVTKTLLTLTDLSADATYYPREQVHDNAGAGLTLDGTRVAFDLPMVAGIVTATTGDGGATKSGSITLYVM